MINEAYKAMLGGKSVIRELSEYATARGAESATRTCSTIRWAIRACPARKASPTK